MSAYKSEHGQTIVLIGLALVVLFGFAALAVDGGRMYAEQRRAQNAADAAAYAAASAGIDSQDWEQAGLAQAGLNDFVDADANANPGAPLDVEIYHPPVDGEYAGDPGYYQAKIRNHVDQVFSQIVYHDGLEVSVDAVARGRVAGPAAEGDAIRATSPDDCQAIKFHGTNLVHVTGGNVTSESNAVDEHGNCHSIIRDGLGNQQPNVIITDGGVRSVGDQDFPGEMNMPGGTLEADFQTPLDTTIVPVSDMDDPDCSDLEDRTYPSHPSGIVTLEPGYYEDGIQVGSHDIVHMNGGMYCLGGDFSVNSDGEVYGDGVFIDMVSGSVDFNGQAIIVLQRGDEIIDHSGRNWGGMLLYMPVENTGRIFISGGTDASFYGTIWAIGPVDHHQYKCEIEGGGDVIGVHSSIYCYSLTLGGSSRIEITYQEEQNYQFAPLIELME